jgi:signal transduction histidine kinase
MHSYAPPEQRLSQEQLADTIAQISATPLVSGLLNAVSGMLAVLNEHRQVIALNHTMLSMLGIPDSATVLGLRPGEALDCIHAHKEPEGCGNSRWCPSCGAAIAIVSCLQTDTPTERLCALSTHHDGIQRDLALMVRAQPITIHKNRFILLFLQDVTVQEQRAALERTFYHDISNMLCGLVGASELLSDTNDSTLVQTIRQASLRLMSEVSIQRSMSESHAFAYTPMRHNSTGNAIVAELQLLFANHPAALEKSIEFAADGAADTITTDTSLLIRILTNMLVNACEATEPGGTVRLWVETTATHLSFCVWNQAHIPESVALRIFQRSFSTKQQSGRGMGTYSMKLFGERILGGAVSFVSTLQSGTTFRLELPRTGS